MSQTEAECKAECYGKKFQYDPKWKGPSFNEERSPTDVGFLKKFAVFSIIWLGIAVYAYVRGNLLEKFSFFHHTYFEETHYVQQYNSYTSSYNDKTQSYIASRMTVNDFTPSYFGLLYSLASATLCIVYMVLLRLFTKQTVYATISIYLTIIFCLTCIAAVSCTMGYHVVLFLVFLLFAFLFVISSTLFVLHHKKIDIAFKVIQEASSYVTFFSKITLFQLFSCFLFTAVILFAGTVFITLLSIKNEFHEMPYHVKIFHLYNLFGYLWATGIVLGFSRTVLAGAFATLYWTREEINVSKNSIVFCSKKILKNHLGTLVFGSLILTPCQFIKSLLNIIKILLKILSCKFDCKERYEHVFGNLEKEVKCIHHNAYIMCALHGTSFCKSAEDAFNLLKRRSIKVLPMKTINITLLLGQVLIVGISVLLSTTYFAFFLINFEKALSVMLSVLIASLLLSSFMFMVLRIAINTIILNVLEDYERNDGSEEQPYFMNLHMKSLFIE